MKTHYQILGISKDASASHIKASYRALVKLYHPDKAHAHPEAESRIREINAAYSVLSKPHSRAGYDATLKKEEAFEISAEPERCANCGKPTTYWRTKRAARLCVVCTGSDVNS